MPLLPNKSATIQVILVSGNLYKNATFRSKLKIKLFFLKNYSIYKPLDNNCNRQSKDKINKIHSKLFKHSEENQCNNIYQMPKITPTIILETFCKGL